jgi:hypothetical protein
LPYSGANFVIMPSFFFFFLLAMLIFLSYRRRGSFPSGLAIWAYTN